MQQLVPDWSSWSTPRLHIRRLTINDDNFILELHNDPDVLRFIPTAALASHAAAHEWIEHSHSSARRGWWVATLPDDTPVATLLLAAVHASVDQPTDAVEIGWRQLPAFRGHGYVTEGAHSLLTRAFDSGLQRVIAVTDPQNIVSQNVCRRLGMTDLGLSDAFYDETLRVFAARAPESTPH